MSFRRCLLSGKVADFVSVLPFALFQMCCRGNAHPYRIPIPTAAGKLFYGNDADITIRTKNKSVKI
jgi:hypothetical protein